MEAANNNVIQKLREAMKACEEISAKDLKSQKEEIAKQFGELQKAVYQIIDEKGVILANLQWKEETNTVRCDDFFEEYLRSQAEKIAITHGYSQKIVYELLKIKNEYNYTQECKEEHVFSANVNKYTYWTLE